MEVNSASTARAWTRTNIPWRRWRDALLASRRRVVLVTLGLLLLLDLGRSLYVRLGYATPSQEWQPDPAVAVPIAWPPGADLPSDAPAGQRIYAEHCVVCHGPDGRGNGAAAPSLIPRPRDFTLGQFKYKSTRPGQPPSDADLIHVVSNGLVSSAMPYWSDILSEAEIREVVAYVKTFSPVFQQSASEPLAVPPRVPPAAASIERGRTLFQSQGCAGCHGEDARGGVTLRDSEGHPVRSRDLTAPWTFRGGSAPEDVWLRLTTGLAPSPMPSFAETTTPEERWDLVNYVLSLARIPPWEPGGALDGPGHQADPVRRGQYLVHAEMCGVCHTEVGSGGIYRDEVFLAGGMPVGVYPYGVFISRNLTSDPETGLGRWTAEQVAEALRFGRTPSRTLNPIAMPWLSFHNFQEEDARAIGSYLKTLPPVQRRIPDVGRYGFLETVLAKIAGGLPVPVPERLTYAGGNFSLPYFGLPRDLPQRLLIALQWLVLLGGIVAFVLAGPRERRFPRRPLGCILAGLLVLAVLVVALVGWVIYELPGIIPAEQMVAGSDSGIFKPDPATFAGPEQAALAERGRYLFSVASCALCHGENGAGGFKNNGLGFGTMWSRNITPDEETGIGAWSDAQVARAIRGGVSRDGRALHWQAMVWDHFSNWDEEDIRALVAYLRTLPPVRQEVPLPVPPAPDDCREFTAWTGVNMDPGCR